ncbi:hypothetical protein DFJ73DRAFT_777965 [Zopfochytrium polystomum]|nr:hypothetical protein DFJ73DRAFT_777965 [Zopfochytrium polystomum]
MNGLTHPAPGVGWNRLQPKATDDDVEEDVDDVADAAPVATAEAPAAAAEFPAEGTAGPRATIQVTWRDGSMKITDDNDDEDGPDNFDELVANWEIADERFGRAYLLTKKVSKSDLKVRQVAEFAEAATMIIQKATDALSSVPLVGLAFSSINYMCRVILSYLEDDEAAKSLKVMKFLAYFRPDSHLVVDEKHVLENYAKLARSAIASLRTWEQFLVARKARNNLTGIIRAGLSQDASKLKSAKEEIESYVNALDRADPSNLAFDISSTLALFDHFNKLTEAELKRK